MLRYFYRVTKPSMELSELIDTSGIDKHKINDITKKFPDIYDDYGAKFAYIQMAKKPREIVSFCLQSFCELCLSIWNGDSSSGETTKLRHDFVAYIVKKILRGEELRTKPGQFNWNLLYPQNEKEPKDKDFDPNSTEEAEERADVDEDEEKEEAIGSTNDPFKGMNDLDIDDVDIDDEDSGVRVGEDLGLS